MDTRTKSTLLCLSVFCIPLLCLITGGAASPFRFLYFPLILLLSQELNSSALLLTGTAYLLSFSLLPHGAHDLTAERLGELCAYLLSAAVAGFCSRQQQQAREGHDTTLSALHSMSDAISHKNMNLQTTLDALTTAHQKLQEYDCKRTRFLSNVSHELRTPLSSIRSYSEILLTYDDIDNDTRREFIHIINTESERLSGLVESGNAHGGERKNHQTHGAGQGTRPAASAR